MKKRVLSLTLALALCVALAVPALAAGATAVTSPEELLAAVSVGGDIVLESDIGVKDELVIEKSSHIDLNGHKLTVVVDKSGKSGILIELAQTLTISDSKYSKFEAGEGKLTVNGRMAGIMNSGASLVINSGVVDAIGQSGAGIGGMNKKGYYEGGAVTINGGIITASGGDFGMLRGAGIGGCGSGSSGKIIINGGNVTATGVNNAAGIGGGFNPWNISANVGDVTITGGHVKAGATRSYANADSGDIGCGSNTLGGGSIKVTGGTVELANYGFYGTTPTLRGCTIIGEGAGDYKGSYDAGGNPVTVTGTSGWAAESVAGAVAKGLVPQNLQSDYAQPTTRAEFCALAVAFYEAAKGEPITQRKTFSDTSDPNIEKMGALGVVSGVGGDRFDPKGTLTREQAATMLARLAEAVGEPLPAQMATFADRAQISSWAAAAVGQVQGVGVMGGVGDNRFDPAGLYSREQSMITILRLYELLK